MFLLFFSLAVVLLLWLNSLKASTDQQNLEAQRNLDHKVKVYDGLVRAASVDAARVSKNLPPICGLAEDLAAAREQLFGPIAALSSIGTSSQSVPALASVVSPSAAPLALPPVQVVDQPEFIPVADALEGTLAHAVEADELSMEFLGDGLYVTISRYDVFTVRFATLTLPDGKVLDLLSKKFDEADDEQFLALAVAKATELFHQFQPHQDATIPSRVVNS